MTAQHLPQLPAPNDSSNSGLWDHNALHSTGVNTQQPIYGHAAHGPAARPFGTAHGPHGTVLTVLLPAQHEGQRVSWAAGEAHDTAQARHG
jgi:hypothetical protein